MSSDKPTDTSQKPATTPEQDAVNVLLNLPNYRRQRLALTQQELKQVDKLLQDFLMSPARRTAPSKPQLTVAVDALLPSIDMHVSPKFNKPQLAAVVQRWVQEALLLDPTTDQNKLYVEIKSMNSAQREVDLSKAIYIEEDDGSVATFAISSPEPTQKDPAMSDHARTSPGFDIIKAFPVTPDPADHTTFLPECTATVAASPNNVIQEIESLAAINLADPGVGTPVGETARAPDVRSSGPGHEKWSNLTLLVACP